MKNLIVANWKLNPTTKKEAEEIFSGITLRLRSGQEKEGDKCEVVVCPPFVYISDLARLSSEALCVGGQNVFYEEKGAFTGEVSPAMLKNLGIEYVIIGHSERRKYFGETDETINKKIKKSLEAGLKVIFCIGETQEQHDAGEKNEVLEKQIKIGLAGVSDFVLRASDLVIAYEPVWAIGTGNNCGTDEAREAIEFIKKISGVERILYGGSVKSENSGEYIKNAGANGLLVGGASLNAEEFIKIIKSAE
jgi:triosephosphate isomerase